jgi:palmitoyltransferase
MWFFFVSQHQHGNQDCCQGSKIVQPPPSAPPQPSPEEYKTFDIVKATQYGVKERVVELVEGGYEVNQLDRENVSLLHWAAINNRAEIVK